MFGNDPTYIQEEIQRNPIWKLAFTMSEIDNDNAPLGWGKYIRLARWILEDYSKKLNLEITIAADNTIEAFAAFVNYDKQDSDDNKYKILINFNAMFGAMVENNDFGIIYKEFFAENVVHEMLHMIQKIFEQSFDEDEVEQAILDCRKINEICIDEGFKGDD